LFLDELYDQGVEACEYILSKALHVEVRKALNPLNLHEFEHLSKSIAHSLKGLVIPVEDRALKKAMNVLDAKWTEMTPEARGKLLGEATKYVGGPVAHEVIPKISQTLNFAAKDIISSTKKNSVLTYDLNISPSTTATDDRVLSYAVISQGHYIRNQYGVRENALNFTARGIVANGLSKGLGSADISARLYEELAAQTGRGRGYWDMIAMTFANRARTMTQLHAFNDAGVTSYLWESVLDEATSDQCRYMHGRRFSIGHAMQKFQDVENASDPEAIEQIQPFLSVGNHPDGGKGIYYDRGDNGRAFITTIKDSGVGFKDDVGSYSPHGSDASLAEQGLHAPPIHGRCRSTIIPADMGGGTSPSHEEVPPEPAKPPPKLSSGAAKAKALSMLDDVKGTVWGADEVDSAKFFGKTPPDSPPWHAHPQGAEIWTNESLWDANKVSKKPKIDDLVPTTPAFDAPPTAKFIQKPKALDDAPKPKVVKYKDEYFILSGHEQIAAQKLMGQKLAYCDVVDLDKKLKPGLVIAPKEEVSPPENEDVTHIHATPSAHPVAPPPLSPAMAHPSASVPASTILGEKTGAAQGSNEGGFYKGTDGVSRYVKFYKDPSQAYGEHLANSIYGDLGHAAPGSNVFEHEGKTAYASNIVAGKPLGTSGLTPERAKEVMKGFVADVLVGNWDVAGKSLDNLMVDHAGQIVRIDNGGSFLMRAMAGRKPDAVLNKITEWDKLFDAGTNPSYAKIAHAAGYDSPAEMKDLILPEIKKVSALRDAHGGWAGYVEKISPGLPAGDKAKMIDMLEARTTLLEEKAEELKRPAPADRSQPIIGHLPAKPLPPRRVPIPFGTDVGISQNQREAGKAEVPGSYRAIAHDRLPTANSAQTASVGDFTGSHSSDIRKVESKPEAVARAELGSSRYEQEKRNADQIEKFFTNPNCKPSPCTVYRGLDELSDDTMRSFLNDDKFKMGATSSTSRTPGIAMGFGGINPDGSTVTTRNRVLLVLKQKHAVAVETISRHEDEDELLLHKDATFKVTNRYKAQGSKNVMIIEAEQIDDGPKAR